jgi:hypothetical protein
VVDVPDAFFVNYTIDEGNEVSADAYPQGTLVKPQGGADVYYINADGEAQPIADEAAFEANRFQWEFVTEAASSYELPTEGDTIDSAESSLIDPSEGASGDATGPVGSGLSVALASDTPASASIPDGAAKVAFTKINLTASNDGAVTIEDLILNRIGVGDEDELGDVYLYEGATKVADGENISSDDEAEFLGVDYKVPAGETKTLTVRANVAYQSDPSGNHGFSIQEAGDIVTNGASVSGSFPIKGNIMSLSSIDAGDLTFAFGSVNGSVKIGEEQKEVAEFDLTASDVEDVAFKDITLTNEGSANSSALDNFKLYIGGDVVAETASTDSDEVTMTLDEPYMIEDGETETFTLKADVQGETGEDIEYQLDSLEDITGEGQKYGYYVTVLPDDGTLSGENGNATLIDIETGDLAVTEADDNPSAQDAARDQSDVTFLKAELQAENQPLTVTDYTVDINASSLSGATSSENYIENVTIYLDGERVAGPEDVSFSGESTSASVDFEDELELDGDHILEVQADFTNDTRHGDYTMTLDSAKMTVEDSEGDEITDVNGSADGNAVTVSSPQPGLSKDATFGNKDVVSGNEVLAGRFILSAGDSEALEIDSYDVGLHFTENGATTILTEDDIEDLKVNGESYVSNPDATSTFSVDEEVAAGEDKAIEVYLTISDDVDADNIDSQVTTRLSVEGEGKVSGEDFSEATDGQTMTLADGVLTASVDAATPDADIMLAQSTDNNVGKWEFSAENTGFTITEVEITAYASTTATTSSELNDSAVTGMTFGDASDNTPVNGVFEFDTDIRVEADQDKKVNALANFNDIDNIDTDDNKVQFIITSYSYISDNESTETSVDPVDLPTNELMEIYDSKITVSSTQGDSSSLGNTDNYIMDVTITNDGGEDGNDSILKTLTVDTDAVGAATVDGVDLEDGSGESVLSNSASSTGTYTLTLNEGDGTIASGESKTFQVVVSVTGAGENDSVTAQVLGGSNFEWSDDDTTSINGDLVEKLPTKTYELIR